MLPIPVAVEPAFLLKQETILPPTKGIDLTNQCLLVFYTQKYSISFTLNPLQTKAVNIKSIPLDYKTKALILHFDKE
jgi:hypothetical protein